MTIAFQIDAARPQAPLDAPVFHQWVFPDGTAWTSFYRAASGYILRFPGLADFAVSSDGLCVTCRPAPGVSGSSVRHLYLNQVLPLAQSRHGELVFHASAVQIDRGCIAFMGVSGLGKSTLAASFATNGHPFLTDDGLEVSFDHATVRVTPSHPSIRLWRDSQEALLAEDASMAEPVQYTTKARFLAEGQIAQCRDTRPLRAVYVLGALPVQQPRFEPISGGLAVKELVRHSFLLDFEEQESLAKHFDELAKFVERVPFFTLNYPRDFSALPLVRREIIDHTRQIPPATPSRT